MFKIAVVDDDENFLKAVSDYVVRYMTEKEVAYEVIKLRDGMDFFNIRNIDYDIILMDIKMPLLDGMEAAKKLRANGCGAQLIFVTSMAQYAIQGYEVDAISFLLKPVTYFGLCEGMNNAIKNITRHENDDIKIVISTRNNTITISASSIHYVEVQGMK